MAQGEEIPFSLQRSLYTLRDRLDLDLRVLSLRPWRQPEPMWRQQVRWDCFVDGVSGQDLVHIQQYRWSPCNGGGESWKVYEVECGQLPPLLSHALYYAVIDFCSLLAAPHDMRHMSPK